MFFKMSLALRVLKNITLIFTLLKRKGGGIPIGMGLFTPPTSNQVSIRITTPKHTDRFVLDRNKTYRGISIAVTGS